MKIKKKLISLITIAVLVMTVVPVFAEEADKDVQNSGYVVSVEAGLDGVMVEGKATPVSVSIRNNDKDFEGVLRVIVPTTYDQKSLAYEKAVTIPSGGEKTFSVLLPSISTVSFLRIELENDKGKITYSQQEKIISLPVGQEAVLGVLSSDYTGLNYFDGVAVNTYNGIVTAKMIQLNADNLPEVSDGLEICDFILIDNYNTSQLSEAQRNAIAGWVNNGGILILGTGSKASVVLEGFSDTICPVTVDSLSKNSITVHSGVTYELENVDVAGITTNGWYDIQGNIATGAPAWQSFYGGGSVLILSYDLAMNPIANWTEGRTSLAENILSNAGTDTIYDNMIYGSSDAYHGYYLSDAVDGVDRNKIPNALLYGAIFFVYVIGIGPVSYLVLRAMDKREKIWIVMPAVALGFTLIVLATSMIYKIHKPFIDAVSILEYNNGATVTKTYMSVQSPKGKAYSIDLSADYTQVASWNDDDVSYNDVGTTNYRYAIVDAGDHIKISMEPNMAFTKQSLMAEKQEYQSGTGFDTNLTCTLSGFEGTLTNNTGYDLTNVVISYNDQFIFVGKMKNGETVNLNASDLESCSNLSYGFTEWMEEAPDDYGLFHDTEHYRDLVDNQNLYKVMDEREYELSMNQGMIFGMIDGYESDVVDSFGTKVYSTGIAVSYFYQVVEEYQNYSVFIDDINDYMVGGDNISYTSDYPEDFDYFYDTTDLDMYGETEMEVLYDFYGVDLTSAQLINNNMPSTIDTDTMLDIDDFDSMEEYYEYLNQYAESFDEGDYCNVQLYNYTTQQYEDVFAAGVNTVANLHPYINENGWMQVRYYIDDTDTWGYYAPNISLVGGEQ